MEIGKKVKTIIVQPLEAPAPLRKPALEPPAPQPVVPEREKVPA